MKIQLLLALLLPIVSMAQQVEPIESTDYLSLIKKQSADSLKTDSTNSFKKAVLRFAPIYNYDGHLIKDIRFVNDSTIQFQPAFQKAIFIGGTFSSRIEIQRINQQPAVQQQYAQGRSVNGTLNWRGPHTNEIFSYGPLMSSLEFDGSNYPFDKNGQLVASGAGNGINAATYNTNIFRTAALLSNAVTLQAKYKRSYQQVLAIAIKAGQTNENSFIIYNKNRTGYFSSSVDANIKSYTISASHNYQQENFSNNNRNGFLNRVYQSALLTPVSFDNKQGNMVGSAQRSFSAYADNPLFLLQNNDHAFLQQQYNSSLKIERRFAIAKIKILQAYEKLQQQSNEGYKPGTAFFANGLAINRTTHDGNYFLNANAEYIVTFYDSHSKGTITANYIYSSNRSAINYSNNYATYKYQRSSNDATISYAHTYSSYDTPIEGGVNLANKIYGSNTAAKNNFFLPSIAGFIRINKIFNDERLRLKLATTFSRFNSELPIDKSLAQSSMAQTSVANNLQYLPLTEVNSFDNLLPIDHKEKSISAELSYKRQFTFSAEWFSRSTYSDIFPVMNGNKIELINMADHRNRGFELGAEVYSQNVLIKNTTLLNNMSFTTYKSKVTDVKAGYNYTAIAGFSEVHKAIVKDAPLGAIVGNTFLKDANNNMIIGTDGFPLVNNSPAVIGNAQPDFIVKLTNHFISRKWNFTLDWEWRKGGDIWNGTQALLDYYGRSAGTAAIRNTVSHVFAGVDVNGKANTIPVNFYDPSLPVEQNRWVRYGHTGVAESYIQKADCIRLNNIGISKKIFAKKYVQQIDLTLYASNIIIWSAYKGADARQLLNDQSGTSGLDFFNIPSYHSFGFSVSLKF